MWTGTNITLCLSFVVPDTSQYIENMKIFFSESILTAAPEIKVVKISADIINRPSSDSLWDEVENTAYKIQSYYQLDQINKRPAIAATRKVYKALGKEPNRYRPSAEALCRRVINGKGLYRLTSAVDIINIISLVSGYSIGGFDADKIEGDKLVLGVGQEGERFCAIGRGTLNIQGLPVYRDKTGPIGTPTSDEVRTSLSESTIKLLMLINIYGEEMTIDQTVAMSRDLLERYASASDIMVEIICP